MPRKMAHEPHAAAEDNSAEPAVDPSASKGPSKIGTVLELLRRHQGATLAELVEATGWLPHTMRAALTGLRKKGHVIDKFKRHDVTCYRIAEAG